MFWAIALKLPVMVHIATRPGTRNCMYGCPWEVTLMPSPKIIRYIKGEIIAATVIL